MKICSHSDNQNLFRVCSLRKGVKSAERGQTSLSIEIIESSYAG